jgi:hypothetical protein
MTLKINDSSCLQRGCRWGHTVADLVSVDLHCRPNRQVVGRSLWSGLWSAFSWTVVRGGQCAGSRWDHHSVSPLVSARACDCPLVDCF